TLQVSAMRDSSTEDGLHATIHPVGSAVLVVDETPREIHTQHAEDARREIVRLTAEIARQHDAPIRVIVTEPDGEWPLVVDGDERFEYAATAGSARPSFATDPTPASRLTRPATADADTRPVTVIDPSPTRAAGPV